MRSSGATPQLPSHARIQRVRVVPALAGLRSGHGMKFLSCSSCLERVIWAQGRIEILPLLTLERIVTQSQFFESRSHAIKLNAYCGPVHVQHVKDEHLGISFESPWARVQNVANK